MALRPKLSNNRKRKIKMLLARAFEALQNGGHEQCEQLCSEIDGIQPGNADAAYLRGVLARDCDQCEQAEDYFNQAIAEAPKRADFITALAGLYLSIGSYEQAVTVYEQSLSIDPYAINAQVGRAGALVCLRRYDEAIDQLECARKRRPGAIDIRMGLFQACHDSGRVEQAHGHLQDILKRDSNYAPAHYSLALLELEQGDLQAGELSLRQAIACEPEYSEAFLALADLRRYEHADDEDIHAMQTLYDLCAEDSVGRMNMAYALAKIRDDLKQYDDAFAMMQEANAIRHQFSRYDETAELARMQQLMDSCTADTIARHSGMDDTAPVFVIGMPRSGTTLVEQILAAHPDVCACGENAMLNEAMAAVSAATADDPVSVCRWTGSQCKAAAETYLTRLRQCGSDTHKPAALKFTDKTLNHLVHIGSIARLFPKAKIIHVRRNALDVCLSIYKNNITGDLFDYGHDLGELGRYYRMVERLMAHWESVLPAGMLIELDYEQLVSDQEGRSRALLDACGLNWHPACLDFQNASHRVLTASMTQVRQPVYTRSVGAAQHYRKHLQTLADALAA